MKLFGFITEAHHGNTEKENRQKRTTATTRKFPGQICEWMQYGRATVALTRAIQHTYIVSRLDMSGMVGMAQTHLRS